MAEITIPLEIGTRIAILNRVTLEEEYGEIVGIRYEDDIDVHFLYIKSEEDVDNIHTSPLVDSKYAWMINNRMDKIRLL